MPFEMSYEDFYAFSTTGKGEKQEQEWAYLALFKMNDHPVWVLLSEANITKEHCASRLTNKADLNTYKVMYPLGRDKFPQNGVKTKLPWS